jgi:hypothetical protein
MDQGTYNANLETLSIQTILKTCSRPSRRLREPSIRFRKESQGSYRLGKALGPRRLIYPTIKMKYTKDYHKLWLIFGWALLLGRPGISRIETSPMIYFCRFLKASPRGFIVVILCSGDQIS